MTEPKSSLEKLAEFLVEFSERWPGPLHADGVLLVKAAQALRAASEAREAALGEVLALHRYEDGRYILEYDVKALLPTKPGPVWEKITWHGSTSDLWTDIKYLLTEEELQKFISELPTKPAERKWPTAHQEIGRLRSENWRMRGLLQKVMEWRDRPDNDIFPHELREDIQKIFLSKPEPTSEKDIEREFEHYWKDMWDRDTESAPDEWTKNWHKETFMFGYRFGLQARTPERKDG